MKNFNYKLLFSKKNEDRYKIPKLLNGLNISFGQNRSLFLKYRVRNLIEWEEFYDDWNYCLLDLQKIYIEIITHSKKST